MKQESNDFFKIIPSENIKDDKLVEVIKIYKTNNSGNFKVIEDVLCVIANGTHIYVKEDFMTEKFVMNEMEYNKVYGNLTSTIK